MILNKVTNILKRNFLRLVSRYFKYHIYDLAFHEAIRTWSPDIIHAHDLATLPCALRASNNKAMPVVYDAHEMEQHRNPPLTTLQRRWVGYIERKYGRLANQVITVSEPIADFLRNELNKNHVELIYNSPELIDTSISRKLRNDCSVDIDVPLAVYVGGIFINRGIGKLIEALKFIPSFHLALVGPQNKDVITKLENLVDKAGLRERWHLLQPVPPSHVVSYIRDADIGVYAIPNVALSYDYCMPNKLFEMSLAGLPIAASNLNATRNFLNEIGNGLTFDETDPQSIAKVIQEVYCQRDKFAMDGTSVDHFYERYGWPAQAKKLIKIYKEIEEKPRLR